MIIQSEHVGKYELVYFPVRGLGEAIRLLFNDQGLEYEEKSPMPYENFLSEWKPKLKFGQLPQLTDRDFKLIQSKAILRYLGRKHDLYGSNEKEAARIDEVVDAVDDLRTKYAKIIWNEHKYFLETAKPEYIENLPNLLKPFEKVLSDSKAAETGAAVNGKISIADYPLFDVLENHVVLSPECLDAFPCLQAYHKKMLARPNIAAYHQTDAFKTRPINGNDNK